MKSPYSDKKIYVCVHSSSFHYNGNVEHHEKWNIGKIDLFKIFFTRNYDYNSGLFVIIYVSNVLLILKVLGENVFSKIKIV